ncbi:thiol-disulfide oxidoreductase DCC family protein [Paenibacillus sp. strain BS8-2]
MRLVRHSGVAPVARDQAPIVLIDGYCHLCQSITRYLVRHDHKLRYRFAALQSSAGHRTLLEAGYRGDLNRFDSFVLVENGHYYTESGAALRVVRGLGGWRSLVFALMIIPSPIRNAVYRYIARNRYKWFGKSDQCLIPTAAVRERYLPDGF